MLVQDYLPSAELVQKAKRLNQIANLLLVAGAGTMIYGVINTDYQTGKIPVYTWIGLGGVLGGGFVRKQGTDYMQRSVLTYNQGKSKEK